MLLSELLKCVLVGFFVSPAFSAVDSRISSKKITKTDVLSCPFCILDLYYVIGKRVGKSLQIKQIREGWHSRIAS